MFGLEELVSTIGSNVETVEYKDCGFTLSAVGVQDKFRPLWHHCYQDTKRSDLCCRQ